LIYSYLEMNILNTKEVAKKLNVSSIRVRQLIRNGRLPAKKVGRDFVIDEKDIALVAERQTGRPPKVENGNQSSGNEKKFKTIFDIVPELAGKHDNLPSDLSTNKKYLEGLGRD